MNVIAWDVVECEVNLACWYECKQGESRFFGNMLLPRFGPLGNCADGPPFAINGGRRGTKLAPLPP